MKVQRVWVSNGSLFIDASEPRPQFGENVAQGMTIEIPQDKLFNIKLLVDTMLGVGGEKNT